MFSTDLTDNSRRAVWNLDLIGNDAAIGEYSGYAAKVDYASVESEYDALNN